MKKIAIITGVFLLFSFCFLACKKSSGAGGGGTATEENLSISIDPDPGATVAQSLGASYDFR